MGACGKKFLCGKWCKCKGTEQLSLPKVLGDSFPSTETPLSGTTTLYISGFVAKRISDGMWQAILTSSDSQNGYYVVYNPITSTDPTMTVFSTSDDATAYLTSNFYTSDNAPKATKAYDNHSTVNVSTVFTNITAVSYNNNAYARKYFPCGCKRV